jgi:hypothetical protein
MDERALDIFAFYKKIIDDDFVQKTLLELGIPSRQRVFNYALVVWLMLFQRLDSDHTLSRIVDRMQRGEFDSLLKTRCGTALPGNTSAYAHSRERIPLELVRRVADTINETLQRMFKDQVWRGRKVYLLDGSSLSLPGTPAMKESYPPCSNQYRESSWSKVRTLHAHDLITAVALRPEFGAMYGDEAVGELSMLPALLERLERNSVVVADRLYGCFQVAYRLDKQGHQSILRLEDDRAAKFLQLLKKPGEIIVTWTPSAREQRKHKDFTPEAAVTGRFIWYRSTKRGFQPLDYYFFTTLDLSVEEIAHLYSLRWSIEIDLRNIKSTLDLSEIRAKSPEVAGKEIILGTVAYNLVRNVMTLVGQMGKVDPRSLSFARFTSIITVMAPHLLCQDRKEITKSFAVVLRNLRFYTLPKRKREPEPRKLLLRRPKFPVLKLPRAVEKELLQIKQLAA